ncbi:NB-ARC domain-containing protein [Xanthobacter flavus]|uniref:NB-ARC domain-containing protein n=1 Tax=Xanthobacter flavus TaxID=281 RepID=UPI003726B77A
MLDPIPLGDRIKLFETEWARLAAMASYQRIALFIFFDAIEQDLVLKIREACGPQESDILTTEERKKGALRLGLEGDPVAHDDRNIINGLDLGDKYSVLMRMKNNLPLAMYEYYLSKKNSFDKSIKIRNATMHGRPLTTEEYSMGFSLAQEFLLSPIYWPNLSYVYRKYNENPDALIAASISFLDDGLSGEVLNNLPVPDYEDTGFFPRPALEKDLVKKIRGRNPVVTVLGDGGNGKTALTLQTLYGLVGSNDHDFDAIIWISAKANQLTQIEISRIEGAITTSLGIFSDIADKFEPSEGNAIERVRKLLSENKILLAIDNLETILDDSISEFASEVPGQSKIIFTSRIPLGGDLIVRVPGFSDKEALQYLRRLIDAYDIQALRILNEDTLKRHIGRLSNKPLLIKWFALGVSRGLDPSKITAKPDIALQFCMENVFERISENSVKVLTAISVVPQGVSAPIIQHLTDLTSVETESALAELMRFGLLDASNTNWSERIYSIGQFARLYIGKFMKHDRQFIDKITSKYKSIAAIFQFEKGLVSRNPYDASKYVVRSPTEALTARKLREAVSCVFNEDYQAAISTVDNLKIINPGYFEIYRASAFIRYRIGDVSGAIEDYEVAIELAPGQPQLHYFYAGLLMRASSDYAKARDHLNNALNLDPGSMAVLREAARVNFFLYDFPEARRLIDLAKCLEMKTFKDEVILKDLEIQLYIREAEHLTSLGDAKGCIRSLQKFEEILDELNYNIIDSTMMDHIAKSRQVIDVAFQLPLSGEVQFLIELREKVTKKLQWQDGRSLDQDGRKAPSHTGERIGTLRPQGRTENFGFIRDSFGVDTYVARSTVGDATWTKMCEGRPVRFEITTDSSGKTRATNLRFAI